jgi:hypothetical protein
MQTASAFKIAVALEVRLPDQHRRTRPRRTPAVHRRTRPAAARRHDRASRRPDAPAQRQRRDQCPTAQGHPGTDHDPTELTRLDAHDDLARCARRSRRHHRPARQARPSGRVHHWMEANDLVCAGQYDQIQDRLAKITVDEQALPDAQLGPTTTARELGTLYRMIWLDHAGPPEACAAVRATTSHQELKRLALCFNPATGVSVAGKGGRPSRDRPHRRRRHRFPRRAPLRRRSAHPRPSCLRRRTRQLQADRLNRQHSD